jgi:antitoxin component of MazEF toxin-antitoxin module
MPTQKLINQNIRKLTKMGGRSLGLTLPVELINQLGWKEHQKVTVKKIRGALVIRDWRKK